MKHLRLFPNKESYLTEKDNLSLPNVSAIWDKYLGSGGVFYHQNSKSKEDNAVVVATYNAVDDGEYGMQCYGHRSNIKSIKVDGVDPFKDIEDEVEHNNAYELNDSNIIVNWDEWTADCPDEVMFNGKVNSVTLKPKDNSIVLSTEAFASGEISFAYVYIDEEDNTKYINGYSIYDDEWNFDASSNSISLTDNAINGDWWSYYSCAMFLVKYTDDMDFPEIIDTISVVNYTTGGIPVQYSFENEGIHEVEIVFKDNSIGCGAFQGCSSLTSVTIPNSVTSIGDSAFSDCTSLTSITIPDSVTSIGVNAFYYCSSLTSVTIPNSVTSIGDSAFSDCTSLTSITIPDSVTSIGVNAFYYCSSLTIVYCKALTPPALNGTSVFDSNGGGRLICVPAESVEVYKIASGWSEYANSIISEDAPTSIIRYTTIDSKPITTSNMTIKSNTYLNGEGILEFYGTTIGDEAFRNCTNLTSITIPDSVTTIGKRAFQGCSGLTSITIPNSVTSIGERVFINCNSLTSVNIPNSVTSIGTYAFYSCSNLTSVNIPNSVTSIGNYAFNRCTGLTSLTIGDSVTSIGDNAFQYCSGLTSITIPDSVTSIGDSAFDGCSNLKSITIPDSVTSIGERAFNSCTGELIVNCNIPSVSGITSSGVFSNTKFTSVTIGNGVTSIGNYAFNRCTGLTSLTIGDSVTSIGDNAFQYCSGLTSITIPDSVNEIGNWAFDGCSGLTSVTIGSGVTSIGDSAFDGCSNLKSITIPDSVTSIGDSAFDGCSGLTSVTIGSGVTSIGSSAFNKCTGLTSLTIGDSVTSIGEGAFYDCDSLTSVTIGNGVTSIGTDAFRNCDKLTSVYCKPTTPPTLGGTSVFDYNGSGRKIYVPTESVETYKNAANWNKYASSIEGYNFN